jgi:non-homologous end joining protein Ku
MEGCDFLQLDLCASRIAYGIKRHSLQLHMLDSRDFAALGYQRVNMKTGKEVDWAHIVKGYEYENGEFGQGAKARLKVNTGDFA